MENLIKRALPWLFILLSSLYGFGQETAFTYQGSLASGGVPANGSYDLRFTLFDTNSGGAALAGPVTNSATAVSNGLFTTAVEFGAGVFAGSNYWLELAVRTNGGGSFSALSPRQAILPTPLAIYSASAGNAVTATTAGSASSAAMAGNANIAAMATNSPFGPLGTACTNAASAFMSASVFVFTNATIYTSTNTQASAAFGYASTQGATNNVVMDFNHVSKTNEPGITWSINNFDGLYGSLFVNSTHGGPVASVVNSEMDLNAGNFLAIVPGVGTGLGYGHIQIGGSGVAQVRSYNQFYMNVPTNLYPSGLMGWRTVWNSNTSFEPSFEPGLRSRINQTNGTANRMIWELDIYPDDGQNDAWTDSGLLTAQQFFFGTNVPGNFVWGANLTGGIQTVQTNSVLVGTNQITITGNLTDGNPNSDDWTLPNLGGVSDALLAWSGSSVVVADNSGQDFRVASSSGHTSTNALLISGQQWGYTFLPTGGLTVGGNGNPGGTVMIHTNSSFPSPAASYGQFVTSNYDLYWVTPTKTNLVVLGH